MSGTPASPHRVLASSGLVIPDTAQEKQQRGVVVDGKDYLVIDASERLAVLNAAA